MGAKNKNQRGFSVIEIIIVLVVLALIGLVVVKVTSSGKHQDNNTQAKNTQSQASSSGLPVWEYNQEKLEWFVKSGTAPKCTDPLKLDMSPVDMTKVTAVGLPGTYRGYSYKAHGGFRLSDSTGGVADIKLPIDANLRNITRYYESIPGYSDELQYIVDFESDCGIAIRFDHIYKLTPEFQVIAEKSPEPKKNDTRGNPRAERISIPFKAGTIVATQAGFPSAKNYGFDFGVYDYRSRNKISKNAEWAKIHGAYSASTFHGVCWLPLLPGDDAAKAEAMAKDRTNYNSNKPFNLTSDYCEFAPHTTLDFNKGQPTDG